MSGASGRGIHIPIGIGRAPLVSTYLRRTLEISGMDCYRINKLERLAGNRGAG